MSMVFVLVLLSLSLAAVALWAIFWAINKGQFDDLDSPAYSILDDDDKKSKTVNKIESQDNKS